MAVNNGCPECQAFYGHHSSPRHMDPDENGQQRARPNSPENGRSSPTIFNPYYTGRPRTPANSTRSSFIDRQEIIRKIKGGESRPTSPELDQTTAEERLKRRKSPVPYAAEPFPTNRRPKTPTTSEDSLSIGLQIERPRSALHRGDFREKGQPATAFSGRGVSTSNDAIPLFSTSPVAPWHPDFPSDLLPSRGQEASSEAKKGVPIGRSMRNRTTSNTSLALSFVYKPPTSPLVQSSRPDTPDPSEHVSSQSPEKSRRHTFSPRSFQYLQASHEDPTLLSRDGGRVPPLLRSEKTVPYQAHQPRRSLNSNMFASLPHTPAPSARRPSISESPLHHAPMVGSYEESILRGRMSTTPSKPLNFVAQIGVLGRGNCKSNLRCPPHASVPFPAVFYSYGNGGRASPMQDQPSPYVGLIDLENSLPPAEPSPEKRRHRMNAATLSDEGSRASSRTREYGASSERRRKQKQKRRSGSPRAPPGGSYRIPQQGQLQIVIKNPNKTAVKLFLVPYDLSDMETGQKTFIRQRSYSAGPIIDMPLSSRKNLGTDRPEAAIISSDDPSDRPMLRYLIHLNICSPSKGRFYLYKSIRVVFANRVPDGKEKLRNEIQLPEPRYSSYKPGRDSNQGVFSTSVSKDLSKRRSVQAPATPTPTPGWSSFSKSLTESLPAPEFGMYHSSPVQALPHGSGPRPILHSRPSSTHMDEDTNSGSQQSPDTQGICSPFSSPASDRQRLRIVTHFEEDFSFERGHSRECPAGGRKESLLSKKLMDLAFQNQGDATNQ